MRKMGWLVAVLLACPALGCVIVTERPADSSPPPSPPPPPAPPPAAAATDTTLGSATSQGFVAPVDAGAD